jgi:heat shock protein HslJ
MEITWYLMEIRDGNGNMLLSLNRSQLEAEGNGDVYSLRFDQENRVSGKAAPNTYRGPCTWSGRSALTFGAMASTMMASIKAQPAGLEEYAYYEYLKKVNGWGLTIEGRLELYCADQSGQAILVFGE